MLVSEQTYHRGHTPNIRTRTPLGAEYHFGGSILPSLDIICKVVADPASIAQVGNLDADDIEGLHVIRFSFLPSGGQGRRTLIQ